MTVNILGTKYTIKESNKVEDPALENCDGYCDHSVKLIVIDTFRDTTHSLRDLKEFRKQVLRHELIHAFLFEAGLGDCSWAKDEEIVDWIAYQFPNMLKAFETIEAL